MKSIAAILAAAMFVGDRTMASISLAGTAAVVFPTIISQAAMHQVLTPGEPV